LEMFQKFIICCLLYVCSTIFVGWRRILTFDDVWAIRDADSSSRIVPSFEHSWRREKAKISVKLKQAEKCVNCNCLLTRAYQ